MKKFVIIINLIINYLLISIESAYIIKSDYTIENPVTAKVTITGNVNGQFYLYDDQIDSGTQLKGYYKNGLTPRRELKYDELFRFYAILGYSCRNVTVDRLYNDEFVLVNDEFIYVDVTGSFLPYKFRGRIFDPKKGNSIVFRTNRPSWYFGDDIPHTIVVFEKISNIKNKFRRTACGDVVVVKNRKNDKNVRLINKKETDYINSLRDNNSLFDKQHYDVDNDDNDDEEFNEGEADKIALENINVRFKNKIARNR